MTLTNIKKNQKGQALLFVIVVLTIALSIGINVSSRLLSTSSRVSRTDTAARAYAAAEAGIERFLLLPTQTLDEVVDTPGTCPDGLVYNATEEACVLVLNSGGGTGDDAIEVNAFVSVERFMYTNSDAESYEFALDAHEVRELVLDSYGNIYAGDEVTICWNSPSGDSYIYYSIYDNNGFVRKGGFESDAGTRPNNNGFDSGGGCSVSGDYSSGGTIDLSGIFPRSVRIFSLYDRSEVAMYPQSGYDFVIQGHKITSIGKLNQISESEVAKRVSVYRPLPHLPAVFDFALYSEGALD